MIMETVIVTFISNINMYIYYVIFHLIMLTISNSC